MPIIIPPRCSSILAERNALAPHARKTSDGTYANKPGDHNVDYRGVEHAVDVSLSMPGTPYWGDGHDPNTGIAYDQFDVHKWQRAIAAQYINASPAVRAQRWPWLDGGYMHSYDAARKLDIIFDPKVSLTWRVDNNPPSEHIQHGHFSIGHTVPSEQDTQPIFTTPEADVPLTTNDGKVVAQAIFTDPRFKQLVEVATADAIAGKFSTVEGGKEKPNGLLFLLREFLPKALGK